MDTIRTNISALNANSLMLQHQRALDYSLEKLSSGLRINKSADDASGMKIADSLQLQSSSLSQAIMNMNEGVGIIQTADKAMDEQMKILDTIRTKAVQAAQDGQTMDTRKKLQDDIVKLLEELDNIANTTSYNGHKLLSGQFTNKEFQIGGYSNTVIKAHIGSTSSDKLGLTRFETGAMSAQEVSNGESAFKTVQLKFINADGLGDNQLLESVKISTSAGTGLGALADVINKNSAKLGGLRATWVVEARDSTNVKAGYMTISINGYDLGSVQVKDNDADGTLVNTINKFTSETGVKASIDTEGKLTLESIDGRAMQINIKKTAIYTSTNTSTSTSDGSSGNSSSGGSSGGGSSGGGGWWDIISDFLGIGAGAGSGTSGSSGSSSSGSSGTTTVTVSTSTFESLTVGRLTLMRGSARDIVLTGTNLSVIGMADNQNIAQRTLSLRNIKGGFTADDRSAIGANPNSGVQNMSEGLNAGVITLKGAMAVMDIVESAQKSLDQIRTDLGATQNKMYAAINSISVTHVNLKAAESQIRDVDFANESTNFSKEKLMILAGNYALTQASITQQTVMRVLE